MPNPRPKLFGNWIGNDRDLSRNSILPNRTKTKGSLHGFDFEVIRMPYRTPAVYGYLILKNSYAVESGFSDCPYKARKACVEYAEAEHRKVPA